MTIFANFYLYIFLFYQILIGILKIDKILTIVLNKHKDFGDIFFAKLTILGFKISKNS